MNGRGGRASGGGDEWAEESSEGELQQQVQLDGELWLRAKVAAAMEEMEARVCEEGSRPVQAI